MKASVLRKTLLCLPILAAPAIVTNSCSAQENSGPQTSAPPPVANPTYVQQNASPQVPNSPTAAPQISRNLIVLASGTRVAVVLENGISTRSAKPGDSVYLRTSFPITQNNQIIVPIGSYLRGELVDSKRPGRIKGKGEFRIRLNTLILPNGYTVNMNAAPRSADSGGKETMDSEGQVTGPSGKGKDVGTVATTTVTGAGIGAIADGAKGAGIGSGIGAAAGLAAVLLTRGPEAELPRGSTLDVVLEHDLQLDANQINYHDLGQALPVATPPYRPQ